MQRCGGPHGLSVALSPLMTPSTPAVWMHVVRSGHLPMLLPTPLRAHPSLAAATAAPERATPRRDRRQQTRQRLAGASPSGLVLTTLRNRKPKRLSTSAIVEG